MSPHVHNVGPTQTGWVPPSPYYVFLLILLVNEQCDVNKFSPNPHTEIDDACYVLKAKQAHDRFDGRCVEFNEVCGCETGNSGSKSTVPSRIVS